MLSLILAQTGSNGAVMQIIMIVAIIAIFYFFMMRPQQQQQKKIKEFRNNISKGDKVVTAGGIYGKVVSIDDNVVKLAITNEVTIRIDKNSIYPSATDAQDTSSANSTEAKS